MASPFQSFNGGQRDMFVTKVSEDRGHASVFVVPRRGAGDGGYGVAVAANRDQFVAGLWGSLNLRGSGVVADADRVQGTAIGTGRLRAPRGPRLRFDLRDERRGGQSVVLSAVADSGALFTGWSSGCAAGVVRTRHGSVVHGVVCEGRGRDGLPMPGSSSSDWRRIVGRRRGRGRGRSGQGTVSRTSRNIRAILVQGFRRAHAAAGRGCVDELLQHGPGHRKPVIVGRRQRAGAAAAIGWQIGQPLRIGRPFDAPDHSGV